MSQHMDALARANEIRLGRAQIKRELRSGETSILAIITDPPNCCLTAGLVEMLKAMHGVGEHRIQRILRRASVRPTRKIGELTDAERHRLCLTIRTYGTGADNEQPLVEIA